MENSYIKFHGGSDKGKIRTENEDLLICEPIWNAHTILASVIDGVGGYAGGARAAAIAKEAIINYLKSYKNGSRGRLLKEAIAEANNKIAEARVQETEYANMSCVLSVVLADVSKMEFSYAHVGDTRIYRFANGQLIKISHDHSLVGYREEIGDLTEQEAMSHPQRNIISRELGSAIRNADDEDFIEMQTLSFEPGAFLLLCSDGLTDMITAAQIIAILDTDKPVEEKCSLLIREANDAGGNDNITVIIIQFAPNESKRLTESGDKQDHGVGQKTIPEPFDAAPPEDKPAKTGPVDESVSVVSPADEQEKKAPDEKPVSASPAPEPAKKGRVKKDGSKRPWYDPAVFCVLCFIAGIIATLIIKDLKESKPVSSVTNDPNFKKDSLLKDMLLKGQPWRSLNTSGKEDTIFLSYALILKKDSIKFNTNKINIKRKAPFGLVITGYDPKIKGGPFQRFIDTVWNISDCLKPQRPPANK